MRIRDVFNTIFLACWTLFWLAVSFRQLWLGYAIYGSRISNRQTFTAEEHPVAFYTLLAINAACVLLGVFLITSHINSALIVARAYEQEQSAEANRKAERRNKHRKIRPMTDEKKADLVQRARKRGRLEGRLKNEPPEDGNSC